MKKLIVLGIAAVALLAASASAGDYHNGADLVCNECHVMHYSQSHDYAGNPHQAPLANGPHEYLLRNTVNELCLSCHDGSAHVPDVLGENAGTATRNAGALNKQDGSVTGYAPESGHSLGFADAAYPGKGTSTFVPNATHGLECVNCHTPHGNKNFRNVMPNTNRSFVLTYAIGTNDLTKDVFERDATHQFYGAAGENHYDVSNVDYNEPAGTGSKYADMCKNCHADFHGAIGGTEVGGVAVTGGYEEFHRHPASDVNVGALGGGHSLMYSGPTATRPVARGFATKAYRVKVMSQSGTWGDQGTAWGSTGYPTDLTPSCMSCHKSHGNQNPFGLIYATGTAPIDENGDGEYQDLCKQCHGQGYVY